MTWKAICLLHGFLVDRKSGKIIILSSSSFSIINVCVEFTDELIERDLCTADEGRVLSTHITSFV